VEIDMRTYQLFRSQLEQELDIAYKELNDLLSITDGGIRITKLREFATKHRASIIQFPKGLDYASEPELVHNIHQCCPK
jgi:hypothetical protein